MSTLDRAVSLFRDVEIDQDFIRESDIPRPFTVAEILENTPRYRKVSKLSALLYGDLSKADMPVDIPQEEPVRKILPQPKEE